MGEPDSGKTTLLRGVARELAKQNRAVAVIDERREIFPLEESAALPLDILSGIPKGQAVQMALRTLSPQVILLDELGGMDELYALEQGLFSGWNLSRHFMPPAGKKLPAAHRCSICKSAVRSMWQCF